METTATPTFNLSSVLAKLGEFDFILVGDASSSMGEPVSDSNPTTRWNYMQESFLGFARDISQIDADGVGLVIFAGHPGGITVEDNCDMAKVKATFATRQPKGSTPMAETLTEVIKLASKSSKKKFVLIATDGVPDNGPAVARVIVEHSQTLTNDDDFTFCFVQVGDDKGASTYLKGLDNDLQKAGAKFDIVSAYTIDEANTFNSTAELIWDAING